MPASASSDGRGNSLTIATHATVFISFARLMPLWMIILGTFASEDLTCVTVGLLIHRRQVSLSTGLLGCYLGIVLGDLGLWLIGRLLGQTVLSWRWVRKRLPTDRMDRLTEWFDRRGWTVVFASRFLPGTRFPTYLTAGMLGPQAKHFLLWAAGAALLWTPLLVGLVAWLGEPAMQPIERWLGSGWVTIAVTAVVLFFVVRLALATTTPIGRSRLIARVSRLWRWEFWPTWVFHIPIAPRIAWLAIKHRGLMVPTAANPGIQPHGGIAGESKHEILKRLPPEWIVPTALLDDADADQRVRRFREIIDSAAWSYPLILKPDFGERGVGLKLARDAAAAEAYIRSVRTPLLVQAYHPGPLEAGIFYYRLPGEEVGKVFSITDKVFPVLTGDGRTTVERLILAHPRFRMQSAKFLARLDGQAARVLAEGERLPLGVSGNHCQGTLFRDGEHLRTSELEARIIQIAGAFEGFFFGRFDIRYADVEQFKRGREFAIVELNGVTSESTNIYDPSWSLLRAYSVVWRKWDILFEIGARNRARGHAVSSLGQVWRDVRTYYRRRDVPLTSD